MKINELVKAAHDNAHGKEFWKDIKAIEYLDANEEVKVMMWNNAVATRLALVTTETSEAVEALRHNDEDNFEEELADVVIRICDICGGLGIDLEKKIVEKMERNKKRPKLHGKSF